MYGERIKAIREEYGLTREELAMRIMTSAQVVQLWEQEEIQPSISEFIILAQEFQISIDWLVGLIDFEDEEEHEEHECENCEDFLDCKLIPHMNRFIENNKEGAYIHIQLTIDDDDADNCVIYTGNTTAILATINTMLRNVANESKMDYYDLVALLASVYTRNELGGYFGDE